MDTVPFTCTFDCGSRCELEAHVENGVLLKIDTPSGRPDAYCLPRLIPCARGRALKRTLDAPQRLRVPLRLAGKKGFGQSVSRQFREVSWGEALDEVASRLEDVKRKHGTEAVLHAVGAGSQMGRGFSGASASSRFFSFWGSVTEASGNESFYCTEMVSNWMFGCLPDGSDRMTLLDSKLIIMWAMNPAENRMGPNTDYFVAKARDRGTKVVLIDPRLSDSGVLADQWIPIRPGTDAALAASVAYVLETEGLVDRAFLDTYTTGYDLYKEYLLGTTDGVRKTPEWASEITRIPVPIIRNLAIEYGIQKPACILAGWGHQRRLYGEQNARAIATLVCMTGNIGVRGGGSASAGFRFNRIPVPKLPSGPFGFARRLSPSIWAKSILSGTLTPKPVMAYIVASNLINRSTDTQANARALEMLDFVVVHDQYLTPTCRYADVVFPINTDLERSDLVSGWCHGDHLFDSRKAVHSVGGSRTDYQVFSDLAKRLGFYEAYTAGRDEASWLSHIKETARDHLDLDALCASGVMRAEKKSVVELADFRKDPLRHPLQTQSGRIEIACTEALRYGLPLVPSYVPEDGEDSGGFPLILLTPHSKLRSNSCLHANPWLRESEPHALWVNPQDASVRNIRHGDIVEIESSTGKVLLPAKVTERIMPGVVCLYQGAWYDPDEQGTDRGGCANVLTRHVESPSGGFVAHSTRVQVRKAP